MHNPSPSSTAVASSPPSSSQLSPADGFLCVKEGVDEMIKHVANEPSVGLYFVQQHANASMPILLDVKGKVAEKTREVTLHTEDIEDSICAVRSMAEFGLPIADDMIKDINKSLKIISKTQPKRGNYLSSMFNTAKQKASILRWPQTDLATNDDVSEKSVSSTTPESSQGGGHGVSTPSDAEKDDTLISSRLMENNNAATANQSVSASDISYTAESYKKFKEEQELKLQEWLRESKEAGDSRD
ncbi:unnamed protein product [Alopecurus aequalis]